VREGTDARLGLGMDMCSGEHCELEKRKFIYLIIREKGVGIERKKV
jgi:hypothetical protein